MSHLRNYFENNDKRLINKFNHYFDFLIGSQEDPEFLNSIVDKIGPIDLLIDDG